MLTSVPEPRRRALAIGAAKHVGPFADIGGDDIETASLSKAQYRRYERSPANTEFLEFEGRPHFHVVASYWRGGAAAVDSGLDGVLNELVQQPNGPYRRAEQWIFS